MRWVQLWGSLSILWHCLSLGLEWKLTFSSPVATAEFSKFAGISSAALSHLSVQFSSVAQSCPTLCDPVNCSTPGLPVHHQLPEFTQTHVHRVQWCYPAISSSVVPFFSCPQSLPASKSFPVSQLFAWGGQSTGVSALASFLPKKSQGWYPCSPRDSQESSPTPQFKSINSSALSLLHSPTLTSIHDYWKNHSFD